MTSSKELLCMLCNRLENSLLNTDKPMKVEVLCLKSINLYNNVPCFHVQIKVDNNIIYSQSFENSNDIHSGWDGLEEQCCDKLLTMVFNRGVMSAKQSIEERLNFIPVSPGRLS